jgi:hypothetical protein
MRVSIFLLSPPLLACPTKAIAQRPVAYEINMGASLPLRSFGTDTASTGIGVERPVRPPAELIEFF